MVYGTAKPILYPPRSTLRHYIYLRMVPNEKINVEERCQLNLIIDTSCTGLPEITNSFWKPVSQKIRAGSLVYDLYNASVNKGAVRITGPRFNGTTGNVSSFALIAKNDRDTCFITNVWPQSCDVICGIVDTGVTLYTDTTWTIESISSKLRGLSLIRTAQGDFKRSALNCIGFELNRSAWIYCALDSVHWQETFPQCMKKIDETTGGWSYTGFKVTNSNGNRYEIWKKFYKAGKVTFDGVRSGGESVNTCNYFFMAGGADTIHLTDSLVPLVEGTQPFVDMPQVQIHNPLPLTSGGFVQPVELQPEGCKNIEIGPFGNPVRIYLGVDPNYPVESSFLETEYWVKNDRIVRFNRYLPDYGIWSKDFASGVAITIPGINCNGYKKNVYNFVVIVEPLQFPVFNYTARDLTVSGFGDDRSASSDSFVVKNLDVSYAWEMDMSSNSWVMNVTMNGGKSLKDDTTRILSAFIDTIVGKNLSDNILTKEDVIKVSDSFPLPDLVPVMVNADSVTVKAQDLSAEGLVRVSFTNKSSKSVTVPFVIVLFEDLNNDFQFSSSIDRYLGRTYIESLEGNEYAVYEITIKGEMSFPHQAIFAFVDADRWVDEIDEWNNVISSGNSCRNYSAEDFTENVNQTTGNAGVWGNAASLTTGLPQLMDTMVFCYLKDFNRDSLTNDQDTLCIIYTYNNRLHAVNAVTHDSLFNSLYIHPLTGIKIRIDDFNGDGKPEIVTGDALYTSNGTLLYDFSTISSQSHINIAKSYDFNKDGNRDSIGYDHYDSCVTVWSGYDTSLIYVYPFNKWTGKVWGNTVGLLTDIKEESYRSYDINCSFPRYSLSGQGDSVDITVRVANAGASAVKDIGVEMYCDTISRSVDFTSDVLPQNLIKIGDSKTGKIKTGIFEDIRVQTVLPVNTKAIWFRIDGENRYFECNEKDNVILLRTGD
ncbi:MAG: hypothetical protein GX640_20960 [Fibrobacter sp.]|nr:hypothetical protein [Fibrobacter sp.]